MGKAWFLRRFAVTSVFAALSFGCVLSDVALAAAPDGRTIDPRQVVEPAPADLQALAALLDKPELRAWLQRQAGRTVPSPASRDRVDEGTSARTVGEVVGGRIDAMRAGLQALAAGVPGLPAHIRADACHLGRGSA